MNSLMSDIICLFSSNFQCIEIREDCDNYEVVCEMGAVRMPEVEILRNYLSQIPIRDDVYMSFPEENVSYDRSAGTDLSAYLNAVGSHVSHQNGVKFKLTITKNLDDGVESIYDDYAFHEYIRAKEFQYILSVFSQRIDNHKLVFEYQDKEIPTIYSSSICFKSAGKPERWRNLDEKIWRIRFEKSRELCHWHKENIKITPDDFYFEQDGDGLFNLKQLLDKSCLVLTWMHLADYVQFKDNCVELFLNGLRSYLLTIPNNNVDGWEYGAYSLKPLYDIYEWCYSKGDYFDKMMIVRNILSLNIDQEKLAIPPSTFNSVESNFKILQKENVERYLKLRNELSDKLIELQKSINKLSDDYLSEYKKNIVAFLSFIVPLIVVRAMAKEQIIEIFPPRLIIIVWVSLFLSSVYYQFSRREYCKKASMMRRQFQLIQERYKDVLSKGESDFVFAESNENNEGSYVAYLKEKEKCISIIWIGTLWILFLLSLFLFVTQLSQ